MGRDMRGTLRSSGARNPHEPHRGLVYLALPAGALPALAFPAPSLWWLGYGALVPWLLLARSAASPRRAALTGWLGGTGYMLAIHHWLLPSLHIFIFVLAALLGALWAPWGWLVWRLLRGRPGAKRLAGALALLPSGWLAVELVRSWDQLGGPWGLLGASQWQVTPALRLVSVGGVWLVGFLLVAVNTALAALLAAPAARRAAAAALLAAAAVMGAAWAWVPVPARSGGLRVAVVQPGQITWPRPRLARSEELTSGLRRQRPDLVVWGESSVGYDLSLHPAVRRHIASLAARVGADVLVNVDAPRSVRPGRYKSSVLVGPRGLTGQRYDKTRLVPFGEYVPFRSFLGWATSVGQAAKTDRRRGDGPVMMKSGGVRFGPLICFETAFPDMGRQLVRDGAQLLVAQSSTSSFQHSWAPQQHASLAALRAAETGRPVVHATLTGVSAVYGAGGVPVGHWLGTGASAGGGTTAVYDVPLASGGTLYVRFGDWVAGAAMAALAVFAVRECARALRARGGRREESVVGSSSSRQEALNSSQEERRP
jgi:apolipoprotein N-acyltransferase